MSTRTTLHYSRHPHGKWDVSLFEDAFGCHRLEVCVSEVADIGIRIPSEDAEGLKELLDDVLERFLP